DESREELSRLGQYSRVVVAWLGVPVITTALDGTVVLWNRAAAKLWGRGESEVIGKKLIALALPGLSGDPVVEKTALLREGRSTHETFEGKIGQPGEAGSTALLINSDAVRNLGEEIIGVVYTVQDISKNKALVSELQRVSAERQSALSNLQSSNQELQSS